jgi:hypothetical protein
MGRISRVLGCLVIALASSASLSACRDWATGEGASGTFHHYTVNASSGPSGQNPTGTIFFLNGGAHGPFWNGDVSCLSVSGKTAIIGFGEGYYGENGAASWVTGLVRIVDKGAGPGDTFEYVELDRGSPGPPGQLPPPGDPLPGPTDCSTFPSGQTVYVLTDSEWPGIQVVDGQAPQASKD